MGDGGVKVRVDLLVGHFRDEFGDQFRNLRVLGRIALAHVKLRCDCEVTRLGEAPAEVLDVLVHPKDFLNNEHRRERAALVRHRPIGRNFDVGGLHLDFARNKSGAVGGDRLGGDRLDDSAKPVTSDVATKPRRVQRLRGTNPCSSSSLRSTVSSLMRIFFALEDMDREGAAKAPFSQS